MADERELVARESFVADVDGREVIVAAGTRVPAGDRRVAGREALFGPADDEPAARTAERPKRSRRGRPPAT